MEFGNNHHQIQTYMLPNRDMSSLKNRIKSLCARKQPDNLVKRLVFNSRIPLNEREQMTLERVLIFLLLVTIFNGFVWMDECVGCREVWIEF